MQVKLVFGVYCNKWSILTKLKLVQAFGTGHTKHNIIIVVKGKKCLNSEKSFKMTHLYYFFLAILNPFVFWLPVKEGLYTYSNVDIH